jgi:hypothetical protein
LFLPSSPERKEDFTFKKKKPSSLLLLFVYASFRAIYSVVREQMFEKSDNSNFSTRQKMNLVELHFLASPHFVLIQDTSGDFTQN